jgi:hypothetical protein
VLQDSSTLNFSAAKSGATSTTDRLKVDGNVVPVGLGSTYVQGVFTGSFSPADAVTFMTWGGTETGLWSSFNWSPTDWSFANRGAVVHN